MTTLEDYIRDNNLLKISETIFFRERKTWIRGLYQLSFFDQYKQNESISNLNQPLFIKRMSQEYKSNSKFREQEVILKNEIKILEEINRIQSTSSPYFCFLNTSFSDNENFNSSIQLILPFFIGRPAFQYYLKFEDNWSEYIGQIRQLKNDKSSSNDDDDPQKDQENKESKQSTESQISPNIGVSEECLTKHFLNIFQGLLSAIKFLHQHNITHLDIKADNFMYNEKTEEFKVIDFGLSHHFTTEETPILAVTTLNHFKHIATLKKIQDKKYSDENKAKIFDIYSLTASMTQMFYWYYCYSYYILSRPPTLEYEYLLSKYHVDPTHKFYDKISYIKMNLWKVHELTKTFQTMFDQSDLVTNFISQGRQLSFSELFLPNTISNNPQPFDLNQLDGDQNVAKEKLELIFDFMVKMFDDMFNNLPSVEEMTQDKQWSVKYLESFLKRLDHTRNEIS